MMGHCNTNRASTDTVTVLVLHLQPNHKDAWFAYMAFISLTLTYSDTELNDDVLC